MNEPLDRGEAFLLVKTGLENGTIKLRGNESNAAAPFAAQAATADAIYLLTLLQKLQDPLRP